MTCHVTVMSLKEKEKEIQKKKNIKSRKIDKRKRRIVSIPASYNKAWFILGIKVCGMDLEICGLVEQLWLQLICYAICLLHSHNFRK